MIKTFKEFNKLYEGDNKQNDNVIKDLTLYNDFPKDEYKTNISWEEAIEIIRNSKYNVKCVLMGTDKYTRYDWSAPYEFEYKNKTYRYRKTIHRNDSIIDEIERLNKITRPAYKKICICEGIIEYTILYKSRRHTYLIIPLNEQGRKIKRADVELLSPKYLIRIENDILDGYNVENIENFENDENRYINKIMSSTSKEDIDIILNNAFKATNREEYSSIYIHSLCRELELGILYPTDINGKEIINAFEEIFGFDYFKEK
jgi:hypothetical protein